ncbi:MAG: response regulator transcription factor [Pseudoclavibacter sp.]
MRILIVDDDRSLVDVLRRALEREGYVVDAENNGDAGLVAAAGGGHDAIILDLMLPGRSGYRVVRDLRERGVWTPVLMLTAKDGEYDEAEALDSGAADYLVKPFKLVALLAHLRALMRRGGGVRPTTLRAGGLELDPVRHTVARSETPIELTAREFAVLRALMQRAGEAVSKRELFESVWPGEHDGDGESDGRNLVEVYIGALRRKIDAPFGTATITTLRGVGYRLEVGEP